MASASHSQSSSQMPGHESPAKTPESPESPILPVPQAEITRNNPLKPVFPDTMADAQTAFSKHQGNRPQVKTPEPRQSRDRLNGHKDPGERSPSTPGHLAPFDWDEFEARYEEALANADRDEQELVREFEELVKVNQAQMFGLCGGPLLTASHSFSMFGLLLPRSMILSVG
ncbi:hypothetical protein CHGG_00850 [Chaetomium globosum CBS 148.51]|uniref:Uncharacterized protein n=1 Tax=Chaetomium globosum (strain ATCC 6205 / CBS 148.51 / DSM 1962 / NBRC 6347 / NRRL 1970) TaxID=306901 RepID=Q2HG04_CHAGB|nr:uncharacterized protein CHGG_00850 [Chaetomium globosum CBS 148.51]EAQ92615.1 hypothetical protein CHGG_00850 [Chaetomium globosum CBS 148.51]